MYTLKSTLYYNFVKISVNEGKVLLDALANRRKAHVQHVILNGQSILLTSLEKRITYVRHDTQLSPDLNVAQTLTFHSHLRQPPKTAVGKISVSDQVLCIFSW